MQDRYSENYDVKFTDFSVWTIHIGSDITEQESVSSLGTSISIY